MRENYQKLSTDQTYAQAVLETLIPAELCLDEDSIFNLIYQDPDLKVTSPLEDNVEVSSLFTENSDMDLGARIQSVEIEGVPTIEMTLYVFSETDPTRRELSGRGSIRVRYQPNVVSVDILGDSYSSWHHDSEKKPSEVTPTYEICLTENGLLLKQGRRSNPDIPWHHTKPLVNGKNEIPRFDLAPFKLSDMHQLSNQQPVSSIGVVENHLVFTFEDLKPLDNPATTQQLTLTLPTEIPLNILDEWYIPNTTRQVTSLE